MSLLSINEMTTYRWSFEDDVLNYRAAGIPAIGVWRQKLADFGDDKGIELLADSGLAVSNLLWAGGFTGSEGHSHAEGIRDAADAIRLARSLGAGTLVLYTGARNGHTLNHARKICIDALKKITPLAVECDVTLSVEPMRGACAAEWTFLSGIDDALSLLDAVDSPQLNLAFDTYHWGHDPHVLQRLPELAPRIGVVHLGDGLKPPDLEQDRHRLGQGTVPLREIIAALVDNGYEGYFDVELMGENFASADYHELLTHTKQAFEGLVRDLPLKALPQR